MPSCGRTDRHYCGSGYTCPGNEARVADADLFCNAPHPDTVHNCTTKKDEPIARCRRLSGHTGPHQAFITGASATDEWDDEPQPVAL